MNRDELLLAALRDGEASTAALSVATGLKERRARAGIARLIPAGYVWSPVRGRYALTAAGAAIAAELRRPPSTGSRVDPAAAVPSPAVAVPIVPVWAAEDRPSAAISRGPSVLIALGALIAGLLALAAVVRGRAASRGASQPASPWDRPDDLGQPWSW